MWKGLNEAIIKKDSPHLPIASPRSYTFIFHEVLPVIVQNRTFNFQLTLLLWGLCGREVKVLDQRSHVPSPLWIRASLGAKTLYERKLSGLLAESRWFSPSLSEVLLPPQRPEKSLNGLSRRWDFKHQPRNDYARDDWLMSNPFLLNKLYAEEY